jgi:UDP-N-acetylglucosamine:LPS N-acetylglucosamine transferase
MDLKNNDLALKPRLVIMYSKAGGGHMSMAKSLSESINTFDPDIDIVLKDCFEYAPLYLKKTMTEGYTDMIDNKRWIWNILYFLFGLPGVGRAMVNGLALMSNKEPIKFLKEYKPDIIATTYFIGAPMGAYLDKAEQPTRIINVVTDLFTPPKVWFLNPKQEYIVASTEAKIIAKKRSVKEDRIKIFQGMINPRFDNVLSEEDKAIFRKNNSIDSKWTLLLMGGGPGLKQSPEIVKGLIKEGLDNINIIILCGRNKTILKQLKRIIRRSGVKNIYPVSFVDTVKEYINISDLIVTKAGPASVMEVLSQKKNMIIADFIWGQEIGNVDFVTKNHYGIFRYYNKQIISEIIKTYRGENTKYLQVPNIVNETKQLGIYLAQQTRKVFEEKNQN